MIHDNVVVANQRVSALGEGPLWDPIRRVLLWVDITAGIVYTGTLSTDGIVRIVDELTIEGTAGAVAVSERGEWVVAGPDRLYVVDRQGARAITGRLTSSGHRLNDGKPDPAGRFVVGSLSLDGPSSSETLMVVQNDGSAGIIDADLGLSNGLAWTADGRTMYSIDTQRRIIFERSYDPALGVAGQRYVFLELDAGYPDGMTIDAEGHLWVAIWGLGQVRRYSPAGGLVTTIQVPAPHVSSVAFAGPNLDTLIITTATQDLSEEQLSVYPLSGRLFAIKPGVRGLPQPLWGGTSLPATR